MQTANFYNYIIRKNKGPRHPTPQDDVGHFATIKKQVVIHFFFSKTIFPTSMQDALDPKVPKLKISTFNV